MAYQVIDGQAYVIDTQSKKVYTEQNFSNEVAPRCKWAYNNDPNGYLDEFCVCYMRTDNLQPTSKVANIVKNANEEDKNTFRDHVDYGDTIEPVDELHKNMRLGVTNGNERS